MANDYRYYQHSDERVIYWENPQKNAARRFCSEREKRTEVVNQNCQDSEAAYAIERLDVPWHSGDRNVRTFPPDSIGIG